VNSTSPSFQIKPKLPLWAKLAPVVVVGGVIAILSSSKEEEPDLPGPIDPDE
jgi:hypothetical protein